MVHQDSTIELSIETLSKALKLGVEFEYIKAEKVMQRIFDFKQEEELITYVNTFKGKLERLE